MMRSSYNLITPVRNEEEHLPKLAKCVIAQSLLPEVWMIVDHKSSDRTPDIINNLINNHDWIHSIRYDEERTGGKFFTTAYKMGIDESLKVCDDVQYIVKIDADMRFHDETLERVIKKTNNNNNLVITGARLITLNKEIDTERLKKPEQILDDKSLVIDHTPIKGIDMPFDGFRIFKKDYLTEVGGIPVIKDGHHILKGKALERGYEIGWVDEWVGMVREMRKSNISPTSSFAMGKELGYSLYYRHYHPIFASARILFDFANRPLLAFGEVIGYLESFINQKERIKDPEVIRHYRRGRFEKMVEWIR